MAVKIYEEMFGQSKLDIRLPYQREFVYGMDNQKAVIKTVIAGYPLNVMYWAKKMTVHLS